MDLLFWVQLGFEVAHAIRAMAGSVPQIQPGGVLEAAVVPFHLHHIPYRVHVIIEREANAAVANPALAYAVGDQADATVTGELPATGANAPVGAPGSLPAPVVNPAMAAPPGWPAGVPYTPRVG